MERRFAEVFKFRVTKGFRALMRKAADQEEQTVANYLRSIIVDDLRHRGIKPTPTKGGQT